MAGSCSLQRLPIIPGDEPLPPPRPPLFPPTAPPPPFLPGHAGGVCMMYRAAQMQQAVALCCPGGIFICIQTYSLSQPPGKCLRSMRTTPLTPLSTSRPAQAPATCGGVSRRMGNYPRTQTHPYTAWPSCPGHYSVFLRLDFCLHCEARTCANVQHCHY